MDRCEFLNEEKEKTHEKDVDLSGRQVRRRMTKTRMTMTTAENEKDHENKRNKQQKNKEGEKTVSSDQPDEDGQKESNYNCI